MFGVAIVAGLAAFVAHVGWMLRQLAPRPASAHSIQFGILHAVSAGLSLVAAVAIGLILLIVPTSPGTLHAAAADGVFGLIRFLAQMIVAMEARLLPMVTWFWAYGRSGYKVPPPSPHEMRDTSLQAIVFGTWTLGMPALAMGMAVESAQLVGIGAWSLFIGVALATLDNVFVVNHVRASHRRTREAA